MRVKLHHQLLALADEDDRGTGWLAMLGPPRTPAARALVERLRPHVRFLGFTGWFTFPAGDAYAQALCEAWCHCFRDADRWLPPDVPRLQLAHADLLDYQRAALTDDGRTRVDADFVYVGGPAGPGEVPKNWPLMRRCLPVLTRDLGLHGLLVGGACVRDVPPDFAGTAVEALAWPDLMRALARARLLVVPNALDPCPRVIAEALAMNTPVVVNRRILGGWHYVTPFTGTFFDGPEDLADAIGRLSQLPLSPRGWFRSHHGAWLAGERLRRFMSLLDPRFRALRGLKLVPYVDLAPSA